MKFWLVEDVPVYQPCYGLSVHIQHREKQLAVNAYCTQGTEGLIVFALFVAFLVQWPLLTALELARHARIAANKAYLEALQFSATAMQDGQVSLDVILVHLSH